MMRTTDRYVDLAVPRERANWGHDGMSYRTVCVEPDGTVRAWDSVGHLYSRHHDLTPDEVERCRRAAEAGVRFA